MLPGPSAKTPPSFLHLTSLLFSPLGNTALYACVLWPVPLVQAPFGVSVRILGGWEVDVVWGKTSA